MDEQIVAEFWERFLGPDPQEIRFFSDASMDKLEQEFSISPEKRKVVQFVLDVGGRQWARETANAKLRLKAIRRELDQLGSAVTRLSNTLDAASDETWQMLSEAGYWRSVVEEPLPKVIQKDADIDDGPARVLRFRDETRREIQEVDLRSLRKMLNALAECAELQSRSPVPGVKDGLMI